MVAYIDRWVGTQGDVTNPSREKISPPLERKERGSTKGELLEKLQHLDHERFELAQELEKSQTTVGDIRNVLEEGSVFKQVVARFNNALGKARGEAVHLTAKQGELDARRIALNTLLAEYREREQLSKNSYYNSQENFDQAV